MNSVNVSVSEPGHTNEVTHIVIYKNGSTQPTASATSSVELEDLKGQLDALRVRLRYLEESVLNATTRPSPYFGSVQGAPTGLDVRRMTEASPLVVGPTSTPIRTVFEQLVSSAAPAPVTFDLASVDEETSDKDQKDEVQETGQPDGDGPGAEEDVELQEEEEEEDEEEEEVAMELVEFEYKGTKYYKDDENQVYQVDEDGDLDDTPVGVWNETKGKILWYPK